MRQTNDELELEIKQLDRQLDYAQDTTRKIKYQRNWAIGVFVTYLAIDFLQALGLWWHN